MNDFDPKPYCDDVIKFAAQFGKNFSCKPEDISGLEEILEVLHNDYLSNKISDEVAERAAVSLGTFLGQTMLEDRLAEYGYKWLVENNEPCLVKNDDNKFFPIAKVWKRITNGAEDDITFFYEIGIMIADGRLSARRIP